MNTRKLISLIVSILVILIVFSLYYFLPITIGKAVEPINVHHIYIFDGNTGNAFTITDPDDVAYIVENVKNTKLRKTKFSLFYEGYCLKIDYRNDMDENIIPTFIINSKNTVRRDPFFYITEDELCFDYIKELESKYPSN